MKKVISVANAPRALGPYSPAVQIGELVFCSGQIGLDPSTNELVSQDSEKQIRQAFSNLKAILGAAGCDFKDVVKMTLYVISLKDFDAVNEVCEELFEAPYPARATVEVAHLPMNAVFEVDAIATIRDS